MNAQASAGRATCGVVRTLTPVPRAELEAWRGQRAGRGQRQQQQLAVRPRAADCMASLQRLQRGRQRVRRQVADHDHAEPAVARAGPARARGARRCRRRPRWCRGGSSRCPRPPTIDELERGERGAVALAPDDEPLHAPAARRGDAGEQPARDRVADVVHGDELGLQDARTAAAAPAAGVARHEQLVLVVADLAADVAPPGRRLVGVGAHDLRREQRLRARRFPVRLGGGHRIGALQAGEPGGVQRRSVSSAAQVHRRGHAGTVSQSLRDGARRRSCGRDFRATKSARQHASACVVPWRRRRPTG